METEGGKRRRRRPTVVALGNAVLYPAALSKVRDLGPVLVRVRRAAEGAAVAVVCILPCWAGDHGSRHGWRWHGVRRVEVVLCKAIHCVLASTCCVSMVEVECLGRGCVRGRRGRRIWQEDIL